MKSLQLIVLISLSILMFGCKGEGEKKEATEKDHSIKTTIDENENETKTIEISLEPKADIQASGKITFIESEGMVNMIATFTKLKEGEHVIRIDEKTNYTSLNDNASGDRWNLKKELDGNQKTKKGFRKGDIGNFTVDADGNGNFTLGTNEWCIGCDNERKNIIGKAIIIHRDVDDFMSTSGDDVVRVSCGAIIQ